ncbi:thioredoxin peroxidase Tpx1 [Apophysomyces ossiformis]|uniref:thioredoxin-dependent peroxiredoxin n=1 Tax=Apophysomyces ossiformis TaxID=679940 RepID=A0A8H7C0D6_9FUNG|nr:thioredoxin peroxidase Tpx1 [Apophysomyces ossiformis]
MFALRRAATALPRVARLSSAIRPQALARPAVPAISSVLTGRETHFSRGLSTLTEQQTATIQKSAPQWTAQALVNGEITDVSLTDYKGKFLVMLFYPADFTFVCPTEILAFSDRVEEFHKLGAEVVGISVDTVHSHLAWTNVPRKQGGLGNVNIPLVSDIKKEIATRYNVLIPDAGLALRGLFVIDPLGVLRVAHIHDLPIGRSVDETLRVIEAIKFTDEHGEVCPANWRKGDKTIKPNAKESLEYFNAVNK